MSGRDLDGNEADGLRFMLHVFWCGKCPIVPEASVLTGYMPGDDAWIPTSDYRDALIFATAEGRLCDEGVALYRAALARGW